MFHDLRRHMPFRLEEGWRYPEGWEDFSRPDPSEDDRSSSHDEYGQQSGQSTSTSTSTFTSRDKSDLFGNDPDHIQTPPPRYEDIYQSRDTFSRSPFNSLPEEKLSQSVDGKSTHNIGFDKSKYPSTAHTIYTESKSSSNSRPRPRPRVRRNIFGNCSSTYPSYPTTPYYPTYNRWYNPHRQININPYNHQVRPSPFPVQLISETYIPNNPHPHSGNIQITTQEDDVEAKQRSTARSTESCHPPSIDLEEITIYNTDYSYPHINLNIPPSASSSSSSLHFSTSASSSGSPKVDFSLNLSISSGSSQEMAEGLERVSEGLKGIKEALKGVGARSQGYQTV
ncbi:hypothetical protein L486_03023 [Kwoniella mangroviensis CBS 10435]|uniref:Uncharacterized protein n=1 Tax=Kwoniella mangroviensis CBS 10435 TaxID=1331196 RepID=A0A1B9IXT3_9TREE|nr:hypothetical protein L486_03023 [Kwoniella mangroviensis CBS 10435]